VVHVGLALIDQGAATQPDFLPCEAGESLSPTGSGMAPPSGDGGGVQRRPLAQKKRPGSSPGRDPGPHLSDNSAIMPEQRHAVKDFIPIPSEPLLARERAATDPTHS